MHKTPHSNGNGRFYGAVIRVADLAQCRLFFQQALGLGPPVVDSNFWVEFEIVPGQMVVALQQTAPDTCTCAGHGNVAWTLEVPDLDAASARLSAANVRPVGEWLLPTGARALRYLDPEGNPFVLVGAARKAGA